jgi:hypothetical protein
MDAFPGRVSCALVRRRLPELVFADREPTAAEQRHVSSCLACQAASAQYRTMTRGLGALRHDTEEAPADLPGRVRRGLDASRPIGRPGWRRLAVSGASAVTLAVTVALLMRRHHAAAA